jgi:formate/nitrite transporter FocA (FNT family)
MYIIPLAMLEKAFNTTSLAAETVTWSGFFNNLLPVVLGNLVGGCLLVGIVYHIIYRRNITPLNTEQHEK